MGFNLARIAFTKLVEIIKNHPDYFSKFELDTPADVALYISFDGDVPGDITFQTDDFELSDGRDLILNRDSDGHVHGLEIT